MHGSTLVRKKNGKSYRYPKYICSTYCRSGQNNPHGCGCHGVNQESLVAVLTAKLLDSIFQPECVASMRAAFTSLLGERQKAGRVDLDGIRRQLNDLDREIDRAVDNFMRAPTEVLDLVGQKITALKRQREHVQGQLRSLELASDPTDAADEVETLMRRLSCLGTDLVEAEPARKREVFREMVDRIELRFTKKPRGKRIECPLESGLIFLRIGEGSVLGSVSRGDRI